MTNIIEFDFAISYAGENEEVANEINTRLRELGFDEAGKGPGSGCALWIAIPTAFWLIGESAECRQ